MSAAANGKVLATMAPAAGLVGVAAALHFAEAGPIVNFIAAALALASVAHVIGEATDQLGNHLSPAATGIVQSAVGNLPELFVCIFALRAGLLTVVQASLIGSILSNALLVLGLAFIAGGWRRGVLHFESQTPRMIATLLLLAVSALVLPTLAQELHLPSGAHEQELAVVCAVVLLFVFVVLTQAMLSQGQRALPAETHARVHAWSLGAAIGVLAACGGAAAFVSDWFVDALGPAIETLGVSEAFSGPRHRRHRRQRRRKCRWHSARGSGQGRPRGQRHSELGASGRRRAYSDSGARQLCDGRRGAVHARHSANSCGGAVSFGVGGHSGHRRRPGGHRRRGRACRSLRHRRDDLLVGLACPWRQRALALYLSP